MKTIDPTTGKMIKSYREYSFSRIKKVCATAQKAFEIWQKLSFKARGAKMRKLAAILRKNKTVYGRLMAMEMGKPLAQGEAEVEKCAWACDFYSQTAEKYLAPEPVKTTARKSYVAYEPLGVVLAVMPWNFPFWQVFRCAAPTLMAGNSMVLKHASNVSGCALAIEDVFRKAGFIRGLFSTLLISSPKVKDVIANPVIKAVTLTGSTQAGKSIASISGSFLKKTVLELGGSDPYIILKDADLDMAAKSCAASRLINGGQSCVSAKRFIVVESVFKEFTKIFVETMRDQRIGPPLEEGVTVGPMARHDLRDQLHKQVQDSVARGAKLLLGGTIPEHPGAFYPPTVLIDVKPGMPAYDEEMFGPVASVIKVKDVKEAVRVANDSPFGLGAAVFSKNLKAAERIALKELQAGCCFVNDLVKSDPRLPFGGIKQSGYGRELSVFGIREFVNIKTISIR